MVANDKQPSRLSVDSNERFLGQWRVYMKAATKGHDKCNYIPLDDEQRKMVLSVDPAFFTTQETVKKQWVNNYCDFIRFNQRQPVRSKHDDMERALSVWRGNMKTANTGKSKHTMLSEEDKAKVLAVDPDFFKTIMHTRRNSDSTEKKYTRKWQNWHQAQAEAESHINTSSPENSKD